MSGALYDTVYDPDTDFDAVFTRATARAVAARLGPSDRVLELGCATGLMTSLLAPHVAAVVAVDHSEAYLTRAAARGLANVAFRHVDIERYADDDRYDHVLLTNVLHELDDPVAMLRRARGLLAPGGTLHVSLQNPQSLHRLVALELGLIDDVRDVSERGTRYGTRRLWTADEVVALGSSAGLRCLAREGVMLKPLPNAAMAELSDELVEGFVRAARHLPDHCSMYLLALGDADG